MNQRKSFFMKMVRYENTVPVSIKFNGTHIKPNFGFAPTVSTWRLLQFINRAPENLTFFPSLQRRSVGLIRNESFCKQKLWVTLIIIQRWRLALNRQIFECCLLSFQLLLSLKAEAMANHYCRKPSNCNDTLGHGHNYRIWISSISIVSNTKKE